MRPGAPNRAAHSPDPDSLGPQADGRASSHLKSGPSYAGNNIGGPHTRFFTQDGRPLEQDVPPPLPPFIDAAALPFPTHEIPANHIAQADLPHLGHIDPHLTGANWPQPEPGTSVDPFTGHYSRGYAPGAGIPPEDAPVSPLHITLIVTILLAGLALGIGRAWWIDDKLEAAAAKSPAVAASSSRSTGDVPMPSIQSSIDRAYIPPMLNAESDTQKQERQKEEKLAGLAIDPGPVKKESDPPAAPQAHTKTDSPPLLAQPVPPPDLPKAIDVREKASDDEPAKVKAAPPRREASEVQQAKKRKSGKESSQKLASAGKKERISEIDRVRTQAFSETSRDRINEKKSALPDSRIGPQSERRSSFRTNKVARNTVTNSQYARCERINHIIRREQCKWELCNNKWGKGACPSFKHERPFLF